MISLQAKVKLYIVLSIIIFVIVAVSIFVIDMHIGNILQELKSLRPNVYKSVDTKLLNSIYIFLLSLSIVALAYGIFTLIFTFKRGINKYKDIARRINNLEKEGDFNLASIEFPTEDEFGGIGNNLNRIIHTLARFDNLKTQKINTENQKFKILADKFDIPIIVAHIEGKKKIVKYFNRKFETTFAASGDEASPFLDIKNSFLNALRISNGKEKKETESDSKDIKHFIDNEFRGAIDLAITNLAPTKIKKDISSLNGKSVFHCDEIEIIPVLNDRNAVMEIIIIFRKIRKK